MKIMFFMDWSLGIMFLEPIYTYLKSEHPDWDLYFHAHDPLSIKELDERGLPHKELLGDYDWAICCDGWSACPINDRRINTFHGMASKGRELSSFRAGNYGGNHVAMSPYIKDILINRMGVPENKIIDGGLSKFDVLKEIPPLNKTPKILYAPTFDVKLSSVPVLKESIYEIDNLTVHLHSYLQKGIIDYQKEYRKHVKPTENYTESIVDLMANSDIVIADNGSTAVEPLALGKMVIRVKNPRREEFYLEDRGMDEEEIATYPENYYPDIYAFDAKNVEEIKEIIKKEYPKYKPPTERIIDNIGNFGVSKAINKFITK
jgi:hypothetical protein